MNIMIIGNGFDKQHLVNVDFKDFVESNIFKKEIKGRYRSFFESEKYRKFSKDTPLWSDFENYLFCVCGQNKIKQKYFVRKITKIFQKWIHTLHFKYKKNGLVKKIIYENKINFVISLNYTNTIVQYGFRKKKFQYDSVKSDWTNIDKMKSTCIDLHSFPSNQRAIYSIMGHDESSKISKDIFIKEWNKKTKYNPKKLFLNSITNQQKIKKIIIYGYSFGKSDKVVNIFLSLFLDKYSDRIIEAYYKGRIDRIDNRIVYKKVKNS